MICLIISSRVAFFGCDPASITDLVPATLCVWRVWCQPPYEGDSTRPARARELSALHVASFRSELVPAEAQRQAISDEMATRAHETIERIVFEYVIDRTSADGPASATQEDRSYCWPQLAKPRLS